MPLHYLAYGSNLHPLRIMQRVPSARFIGVVEMPGKRIAFNKRSLDGSGKCMFFEDSPGQMMYGSLYEIDASHEAQLDRAEGVGHGYRKALGEWSYEGQTYVPYMYVAESASIDGSLQPYEWYREYVLLGARYHGFPEAYIARLQSFPAIPDPDGRRASAAQALIEQMKSYR